MTLEQRLEELRSMVLLLVERQQTREWYSVEEFARIVGREPFTVRQWAKHGRIQARKKDSGRGAHTSWAICHEELQRYQREGLRPRGRCPSRPTEDAGALGLGHTSTDHEHAN